MLAEEQVRVCFVFFLRRKATSGALCVIRDSAWHRDDSFFGHVAISRQPGVMRTLTAVGLHA